MIVADVLAGAATAGCLLIAAQALLLWDSVKRWQVVVMCLSAAALNLTLLLGGN